MSRADRRWLASVLVAAVGCGQGQPIAIERAAGRQLWEGRGCSPRGCEGVCTAVGCPGGRRPPLVYLRTTARVASATATIVGTDVPVAVDLIAGSADATALAVRIPVTSALGTRAYPLEVRVVGDDGSEATTSGDLLTELEAQGLAELVLTGPVTGPSPPGAAYLYSSIVVPTAIVAQLDGPVPVRLVAAGDIELAGIVSADATSSGPGPGGCPGMASASEPSPCPPGGGLGTVDGSAGGGSFGSAGGGGPLAGAITGNPMLVPVGLGVPLGQPPGSLDDNRGHGGGAHADDGGGAGGGGVVLVAYGRIVVGQYARVTARGGDPSPATGESGGGGSGGAIVVASAAGIDVSAAAPRPLEATGGGSGAVRGGDGRIRVDSPDDLTGFIRATPRPWLGPAWVDVPLVVGSVADLTLRIDPRATEPVSIMTDDLIEPVTCVPVDGWCRVRLAISLGSTSVCAVLRAGYSAGLPENGTCVEVLRLE